MSFFVASVFFNSNIFKSYFDKLLHSFTHQKIIIVLLIIFFISFLIQLYFYLKIYSKLNKFKYSNNISDNKHAVSVIICARNESENLKKNLPPILKQDYKNFEVVVVDDGSTDDTQLILKNFQKEFSNLKVSILNKNEKFFKGKKLALTIGIKAAKNDILLLTDADCRPTSSLWINKMQSLFNNKTDIILGYGGYEKKKGILNKFIRFDTFFIALQYFSFALSGNTYMGIGRNLAYKKQLFFKNRGFASHYHLLSGDDDLFINEVANKKNVNIMLDKKSHVYSIPKQSFRLWLIQKRRHLTTGIHYKLKHKILLTTEPMTRILFLLSFIMILAINYNHFYIVVLFIIKLTAQIIISKKAMKRLSEKDLLLSSLVINILMPIIILTLHLRNFLNSKQSRWK